MSSEGFPGIPEYQTDHANLFRKLIPPLQGVMQGRTNNTGTFTLTANSATTTVTLAAGRLGENTVITYMPTTSNAAAAMTNIYIASRSVADSTFTITHTNNAQVDRTFKFVLTG
jgi:hypothetical protein